MTRTLLLLRHAEAEATRPGFRDRDRRLTEHGRTQAEAVGDAIRAEGWSVDHVCCSSAVRTRETLAGLELGDPEPGKGPTVEVIDGLYNAGSDSIVELIETLPDTVGCALVVGHAPGVPGVLWDLVDQTSADPVAWSLVAGRFPPATLVALTVDDWSGLSDARLIRAFSS
ncbi:MAG: histidine phosphatase family protein [Microlunatus sp.]